MTLPRSVLVIALAGFALGVLPEAGLPSAARALPLVSLANGIATVDEAVVVAGLPPGLGGEHFQLRDDEGAVTPVQVTRERTLAFVVRGLRPNERRAYRLEPALSMIERGGVDVRRHAGLVELRLDGQAVVSYRVEPELPRSGIDPVYRRGGYLHPVRTPQGRILTDDYAPDHLHHHGIWAAWAGARFEGRAPDFWNMARRTGTVEVESVREIWSGPVIGGVRARHRYVDLTTPAREVALTEVWEVTVAALGRGRRPYRQFDLAIAQEAASPSALALTEYLYGPLGVRGHRTWLGPGGTQFLTSEGKTRIDGHGTRARWCAMSGLVDGRRAGLAVLDHPSNVRHPQPMRIHPREPFFSYAPVQLGPLELRPGDTSASRYRFITFDGAPDAAWLESHWQTFANGPRAEARY